MSATRQLYGRMGGWQPNENLAAMCCILCITATVSPGLAAFITFCIAVGAYLVGRS